MTKIILFNSPKGSGKTEIGKLLHDEFFDTQEIDEDKGLFFNPWYCQLLDFKDSLYDRTANTFGIDEVTFWKLASERETKDQYHKDLVIHWTAFVQLQSYVDGILSCEERYISKEKVMLTPREAMIYQAECLDKPTFGQGFYGEQFIENVDSKAGYVVECGTGFYEEVVPLIEKYGKENIFLVQLHREGYTDWGNDSRNWVSIEGITTLVINNEEGKILEITDTIFNAIKAWEETNA